MITYKPVYYSAMEPNEDYCLVVDGRLAMIGKGKVVKKYLVKNLAGIRAFKYTGTEKVGDACRESVEIPSGGGG